MQTPHKKTWTLERCQEDAKQYLWKAAWRRASSGAYAAAHLNGWLDLCCGHMNVLKKSWTLELCQADALQYKTKGEWSKNSSAYHKALKKGWLDLCCEHMLTGSKSWIFEACKADALLYQTKTEWHIKSSGSYEAAKRNGWLDLCRLHMKTLHQSWSLEACQADAFKFESRSDWEKKSKAGYTAAHRNGWIEQCCGHMLEKQKPKGYWTLDLCKADSLLYKTRWDWGKNSLAAYKAAQKNDWVEECCQHMVDASPSDNDVVYIWKAEGASYIGEAVYKIGVTSARLGVDRIKKVEKESEFNAKVIALMKVNGRATALEKKLLALGQNPKYIPFDGSTEFRAMSDAQLHQALYILKEHTVDDLAIAA